MPILPFGEWLPDGPAFGNPGTVVATNVVPRTARSYGPFLGPVPRGNPLPARVCGSYGYRNAAGTVFNFAATQQRIYLQETGDTSFATDVSGPGAPYNTEAPPDGFWSITSFGKRLIATNYTDPIQTMVIGTDSALSNLSANAPRARVCCVIRDFLMVGDIVDIHDGPLMHRVAWPAIGDPTNWPATWGTDAAIMVQSDYQDLVQTDLGAVVQLVGGHMSSADGCALMERGIYRIQYAGSPKIFDFQVAEGSAGTSSPLSVVTRRIMDSSGVARAVVYYLGSDGFYAFDGSSSVGIGAGKVDQTFFRDLDVNYLRNVQGTYDPIRKLVIWLMHGQQNNGLFNHAYIYNWELARWGFADLTLIPVEWAEAVSYSTGGYNLDQMDPLGNLEQLKYSLDSRVYTEGNAMLGWFDGNHQQNFTTGDALAPTIETTETQMFPDRRTRVISSRPLHDAAVAASIAVGHREMVRQPVTYEMAIPENILGACPQRSTGRYTRFRLTLPPASGFNALQGIDVVARPEGIR